jgi:hypothetical protein
VANAFWLIQFAIQSSTGMPFWEVQRIPGYGFFEYGNRMHSLDIPAAEQLNKAAEGLLAAKRPLVFYSNQMGMVSYNLALRHFGEIRFLDRSSLIDRTFSDCVATSKYPKTSNGLRIPYDMPLVANGPLAFCGVPRPDLVYDVNETFLPDVVQNGYVVVWQKTLYNHPESLFKSTNYVRFHFIATRSPVAGNVNATP